MDCVGTEAGTHDVDAVQLCLGGDLRRIARPGEIVVGDDDLEVLLDPAPVGFAADPEVDPLAAA